MAGQSRSVKVALWVLQILAAVAFAAAGGGKLMGQAAMVQMFDTIGFGQWFRYVTGAIEVGSALMLLVPSLAVFGATLLGCTMIGAIIAHLTALHDPPTGPVVLLLIVGTILWLRRDQLRAPAALQ